MWPFGLLLVSASMCNAQVNDSQLIAFIQHLTKSGYYSYIQIVVDEDVDLHEIENLVTWINHGSLQTTYLFTVSGYVDGGFKFRSHLNDRSSLSIVFCRGVGKSTLWKLMDSLMRRFRNSKLIIVLIDTPTNDSEVVAMFNFLWNLHFLHVLLVVHNKMYSFTPFPKLEIFEIRLNDSLIHLFPKEITNLRGHTLQSPVLMDFPRVFLTSDSRKLTQIEGYGFRIFEAFVKSINATFKEYKIKRKHDKNFANMEEIRELIVDEKIEITLHPYAMFNTTKINIGYPIFVSDLCLMIPVRNEIPKYLYALKPLTLGSWLLIILGTLYIAFILSWAIPNKIAKHKLPRSLRQTFLESIAYILYLPLVIQNPSSRYIVIWIFLNFLGFFLTTWYNAIFSSLITARIYGKQLTTMEDLVNEQIPIYVVEYERKKILQNPHFLPEGFKDLLILIDVEEFFKHLLTFNTSHAYPMTYDRWYFYSLQQQHTSQRRFQYSSICFGKQNIGYAMQVDSYLENLLTPFIMRIQAAGLNEYWLKAAFQHALREGYVTMMNDPVKLGPLKVEDFKLAWYILLIGAGFGFIVLCLEKNFKLLKTFKIKI